jgi:hypothetical protein
MRRTRIPPVAVAAQQDPLAENEIELTIVILAAVESEREDD